MAKMTFIIIIICVLYFIKKIFMEEDDESNFDKYMKENKKRNEEFRKEFDNLVNEFGNLSKEEQRNRLINHINEYRRKGISVNGNDWRDVDYLIITNLKMGKDVDVAKEVLLELCEIRCKKYGIINEIKFLEGYIEYYQKKGETEIANIYKELKSKYEEERNSILNIAYNEVDYNIENNCFIETNMQLMAEEGCFEIFDNIEHYEYRTRYGATNYEKIGEGKLYITNKRLHLITEINSYHLIWLNNIIDVDMCNLVDEDAYQYYQKFQIKIIRDGNAIFLESYNEVDIYKMNYYIKTIMKNK